MTRLEPTQRPKRSTERQRSSIEKQKNMKKKHNHKDTQIISSQSN